MRNARRWRLLNLLGLRPSPFALPSQFYAPCRSQCIPSRKALFEKRSFGGDEGNRTPVQNAATLQELQRFAHCAHFFLNLQGFLKFFWRLPWIVAFFHGEREIFLKIFCVLRGKLRFFFSKQEKPKWHFIFA